MSEPDLGTRDADSGIDPSRVTELLVTRAGAAADRRGSGYRVTSTAVLTAAHVVAGASTVRVRCDADRPGEWTAEAQVWWLDETVDLAVVGIAPRPGDAARISPVRFGRVLEQDAELVCSAMGFPRFKLRDDHEPGTRYRDSEHALGRIAVLSNRREGTFAVTVPPPERDPDPDRSPWEGMSGAALWSDGLLIGVVSEHHRTDGPGTLAASRVDRWHERLDAGRIAELRELIALPGTTEDLVDVVPRGAAGVAARRRDAVRAVLAAEAAASWTHPYRLPGDIPHLDQIFVEPWAVERRGQATATPQADPQPVPASRIVDLHRHAVLQGEPGQGKSTFTQHLARTRAGAWSRGDGGAVVVRVPATDLTGDAPIAALLHASVRRRLGMGLVRDLPLDLFDSSVDGPWLLLVDGLDEIVDSATRGHVVAAIAADVMRADSPYRWLLTTRALMEHELRPLSEAGVPRYALTPFDDDQVLALVHRWFTARSASGVVSQRVDGFLGRVADGATRQLIRTPLLTVIALIVDEHSAHRRLPTGRLGLYQEFVAYLLSGRAGGAERREAARRAVLDSGGDERLASRLDDSRVPLLTHLAERTLAGDGFLYEQACAWTREHVLEPADIVHGWDYVVATVLDGTGLLHREQDSHEFLWPHRSVAEYFAARDRAAALPGDWPEVIIHDPTVIAALDGPEQNLGVMTIALWGARPGNSIETLITKLLEGNGTFRIHGARGGQSFHGQETGIGSDDSGRPDLRAALAGRIVAEGVPVSDEVADQVLERLVARAGSQFHGPMFSEIIAAQPRRELAREWLARMATDDDRPMASRCAAIFAIAHAFGVAAARPIAETLRTADRPASVTDFDDRTMHAPVGDGRTLAAERLAVLGAPMEPIVRDLLDAAVFASDGDFGRLVAAKAALTIGDHDRAVRLALSYRPDHAHFNDVPGTILLRAGAVTAAGELVTRMMRVSGSRAEHRGNESVLMAIGEAAADLGHVELAREIANWLLAHTADPPEPNACVILLRCGDPRPATEALDTLGSAISQQTWYRWARLADALHQAGHRDVLAHAIDRLVAERIGDEAIRQQFGAFLLRVGDDRGMSLCLDVLRDPGGRLPFRQAAATDLLDTPARQEAEDALLAFARGPLDTVNGNTELAATLMRLGRTVEAVDLMCRDVADVIYPETNPDIRSMHRREALETLAGMDPGACRRVLRAAVQANRVSPDAANMVASWLEFLGETGATR